MKRMVGSSFVPPEKRQTKMHLLKGKLVMTETLHCAEDSKFNNCLSHIITKAKTQCDANVKF